MTPRMTPLALLLATLAATPAAPAQRTGNGVQRQQKKPQPSWPKLDKKATAKGEKYLKLLRSKKDKVRINAIDQLKILGPGFADRLLRSFRDSKNFNANEQLQLVLDAVLRPEHAAPLSLHIKHKAVAGRRYVAQTLARFGRSESVQVLRAARRDKDVEVAYYAALGLVKTRKSTPALDAIFERCLDDWAELGDEIGRFLENSRSDDHLPWLGKKLSSEDTHHVVTALRLMRILAPARAKSMLRRCLDSQHAIVKKEAINTLRVIVDGKPALPLKKITVFMVIKLAKDWRKRI